MPVPRQSAAAVPTSPAKGPSARTLALMVATASDIMRGGRSPSVSEVAEAAGVSRSTAYRYFPTQADMLRAVVAEALGPILDWDGHNAAPETHIASLYKTAFPRLFEHEATFRAALRQTLETGVPDVTLGRGHRRTLLAKAIDGLGLPDHDAARLVRALSLTFGVEALIVLRDIWGMGPAEAEKTALWAAEALIAAARQDAERGENPG